MNVILNKYKKQIDNFINYLSINLTQLDICCVQLYGSATYENCFVNGVSDIDMIVYCNKLDFTKNNEIVTYLEKINLNFFDKSPVYINDYIAERIECYVNFENLKFDLTFLKPEIPRYDSLNSLASYDSIDIIIGAIYEHGITIYGNLPMKEEVRKQFIPFYDNKIRYKRLKIPI